MEQLVTLSLEILSDEDEGCLITIIFINCWYSYNIGFFDGTDCKKKKNKEDTYFHQRRILKRISLEKILLLRSRVKIRVERSKRVWSNWLRDIGMAFDVQRMKARQRNNWFVHLTPVHRPVNVFVEITRNGCKCQENSGLLGRPFPHPRQGRATISQLQLQLHKG